MEHKLVNAFEKYTLDGKHLDKLRFKCAFIYLTGLSPTKDDMAVIRNFLGSEEFLMDSSQFSRIMGLYLQEIESKQPDDTLKSLTGTKGYMTISEFYTLYDKYMPKVCDRNIALEMFQELDADRDGKLSQKEIDDCIKF